MGAGKSSHSSRSGRGPSSIVFKLTVYVAALILLTIGVLSVLGYVVARSIVRDEIHERLRAAASDRRWKVEAFAAQQRERVGLIASRTQLRRLIASHAEGTLSTESFHERSRVILHDALESASGFQDIWVTDPNGHVVTSTNEAYLGRDFSDHPDFLAGLERRHLGEPRRHGEGATALLTAPARASGGLLLGVVMVRLDVTPLIDILVDRDGLGTSGEVLVATQMDQTVRYLIPPRGSARSTVRASSVPVMTAAIGGGQDFVATTYDGVDVLAHYVPVDFEPREVRAWGLVAKMNAAEAYAPLGYLARRWFGLAAALLFLALLFSYGLARRFTRPIRRLTEAAAAVAAGEIPVRADVASDDEVGALAAVFNDMAARVAADQEVLERRVQRRTAERDRFFDLSLDLLCVANLEGYFTRVNPTFKKTLGYEKDELLERPFIEFVHPDDREVTLKSLEGLSAGADVVDFENRYRCKDGSYKWLAWSCPAAEPGSDRLYAVARDVTGQKAARTRLERARKDAEATARAKSEFLANMSHEIRTPMNGVIGMAELLSRTQLSSGQREYLDMMRDSADSLLRLLGDILDFSKIEAGKLEIESVAFGLRNSIGKTVQTHALTAAKKGIELSCRVAPDVPDDVIGDPVRLRQVIVNLVGNAIKFTARGEVSVDVETLSRSGDGVTLRFSVRDTGTGIPKGMHKKVLEAFAQADASTTRRFGGTGLGLTIASRLVDLMGGEIKLESEEGVGTTFRFTLPLAVGGARTDWHPPEVDQLRGLQVLVVDDNMANRRILEEMLTSWRLSPSSAESASAAVGALRQAAKNRDPFRLLLLDLMMPDSDGFELAERVRDDAELGGPTMIMMSSAARPGDAERCRELGIARYLTKPVVQSELLDAILLAAGEGTMSASGESAKPARISGGDAARVLLAEDGVVNQRVAKEFLIARGYDVVAVGDGTEALEALEKERFDVVLMDVQMPEMDGYEATAAIRELDRQHDVHTPIVALTAAAMKGDREKCLLAGMDGYISKPIDPNELYRTLERILAIRSSGKREYIIKPAVNHLTDESDDMKSKEESTPLDDSSEVFDIESASRQIPGGPGALAEIAALMLEESGKLLEEIRAGIENRDGDRVRVAAHSLRGSASILGAKGVTAASGRLETIGKNGHLDEAGAALEDLEREVGRLASAIERIINERPS